MTRPAGLNTAEHAAICLEFNTKKGGQKKDSHYAARYQAFMSGPVGLEETQVHDFTEDLEHLASASEVIAAKVSLIRGMASELKRDTEASAQLQPTSEKKSAGRSKPHACDAHPAAQATIKTRATLCARSIHRRSVCAPANPGRKPFLVVLHSCSLRRLFVRTTPSW